MFQIVGASDDAVNVKSVETITAKSERSSQTSSIPEQDHHIIVSPVDLQINQGMAASISPRGIVFVSCIMQIYHHLCRP